MFFKKAKVTAFFKKKKVEIKVATGYNLIIEAYMGMTDQINRTQGLLIKCLNSEHLKHAYSLSDNNVLEATQSTGE